MNTNERGIGVTYREECDEFFKAYLTTTNRYVFTYKETMHMMDSDYMMIELLNASEEELEPVVKRMRAMEPTDKNVHHLLQHFAYIYVIGNRANKG